ncbi:sensor histidine kinase [Propionicicella superfundia]|uniref:sensor histidine kinase n=1 Tax=Propionicicella superfundia TaxID=348582 RepID=UPI00040D6D6A|nr:sensor histidine kinase [Propionicicella superfundia]
MADLSEGATPEPRKRSLLGGRRVLGTTGYLLALFPFAMVALTILVTLLATGAGTLVLVVGLPLVSIALLTAQGFGTAERHMLRWTGLPDIPAPEWPSTASGTHWVTRLLAPLRSGRRWVYLIHQMLVGPILSIVSFSLTVIWWSVTLGGLTFWVWQGFLPDKDPDADWPRWIAEHWPLLAGWSSRGVETVLYLVGGAFFAITLPVVVGGLGRAHHAVAGAMLGRWPSDELAALARDEAAARAAAVHAEDAAMRRLERDLHDGPQQRLVRLQLDLAAAERRADAGDTAAAAALAREARVQAGAAVEELRALSRGVAPPLLADRGLTAALAALADDSPLPVAVRLDPAIDEVVAPDVARAVYFIVAEVLTNTAKHAGASRAEVTAEVTGGAAPRLRIGIADDGRGGAAFLPGHGLSGLQERLRGLRGSLTVESPPGGPTRIDAVVPASADASPGTPFSG